MPLTLALTLIVLQCLQTTAALAAPSKNGRNADNRRMGAEQCNNTVDGEGLSAAQHLLLHLSIRCCFCVTFVIALLHSV